MDSSSDDSFVWTKASTGSDDSEEMHIPNHNDDSEDEIKAEINNKTELEKQDPNNALKREPIVKKRKRISETDGTEVLDSPKKKKIKTEPDNESDSCYKKKKKKKKDISNGDLEDSYNQEDEYLGLMVKQERENHEKYDKIKMQIHETIEGDNETNSQEDLKSKKKKKVAKNGTNKEYSSDEITAKSPKKKKRKSSNNYEENKLNDEVKEDKQDNEYETPKKKKVRPSEINNSDDYDQNQENGDVHSDTADESYSQVSNKEPLSTITTSQRTPRLSDRIKFEDEVESDVHSNSSKISQNNGVDHFCLSNSSNFRRFLKEHNSLKPVSISSKKDSNITDDDEIWILKCPHDVDINNLNYIDFNMDNKCKIKINGETYCGNLDDNIKLNVLSSGKKKFQIRNLEPNGIINFRKRLPKPHFLEDNFMVNNQTDFIPLPETKCRHPLFGSNYKDSINIHTKRFNHTSNDVDISTSGKKKKKKHKKDQDKNNLEIQPKIEYDSEVSGKKPKVELDSDVPIKKAKKRKHTNDDELIVKKSKRIKLEPDSTEAWESEKAIEENLFNF